MPTSAGRDQQGKQAPQAVLKLRWQAPMIEGMMHDTSLAAINHGVI